MKSSSPLDRLARRWFRRYGDRMSLRTVFLLVLVLVLGCDSASSNGDAGLLAEAGTSIDSGVSADLGTQPDLGTTSDSGLPLDAGDPSDLGRVPDLGTAPDAGPPPDAGAGPILAVLDTRCEYFERRGLVTVANYGGPNRYVSVELYDRPFPWLGPPAISDASCQHHRAFSGACNCSGQEVCDHDGLCATAPVPEAAVELSVSDGNTNQTFTGDGAGSTGGEITLSGAALGLVLDAGPLAIQVPSASIPGTLINPSGVLTGSYEAPGAVDLAWQAPIDAAFVYSHTNINHHAPEATFTTCVVPASAESLHIDGAMLMPLAVITGLEFQAIEHVRFASASTAEGCVEFRFSRSEYVSLSN